MFCGIMAKKTRLQGGDVRIRFRISCKNLALRTKTGELPLLLLIDLCTGSQGVQLRAVL